MTTSNIATSNNGATLCSENSTLINSSYTACAAGDSDSDGDIVSSKTGGDTKSSKGNFASQTVGILREERGSQVNREEEEGANEERKEGERSELARLRISLIEAKVD